MDPFGHLSRAHTLHTFGLLPQIALRPQFPSHSTMPKPTMRGFNSLPTLRLLLPPLLLPDRWQGFHIAPAKVTCPFSISRLQQQTNGRKISSLSL